MRLRTKPISRAMPVTGALALAIASTAVAAVALTRISTDTFTNATSQHATEVEPDTFAAGSTIVSAFQAGRFFDGGSSDNGWATSHDSGATWQHGFLPGTTTFVGGSYDRVSDPSVAFDAKHNVWLISSLALVGSSGAAVLTSRSTDGGLTWGNPVVTSSGGGPDKNWIVCDDAAGSKYYGHCYTEWDQNGNGNRIKMSTSTDGGLTWGPALSTADNATGIGGQPLVRRNGVVIVPIDDAFESSVRYFTSTNGGASWSTTKLVASITDHAVAGNMRTEPLPTAEIDKTNRVYIVWQDCRFEPGCSANDLVMVTIRRSTVSPVTRIPINPVGSGVDHFIPGIAVDGTTGRSSAHLGLTYYYYPVSNCGSSCQLHVGFVSSTDSGATWSAPVDLAVPMSPSWLASTSQGVMVGDYISGSFAGGSVHPVFAVANAPSGPTFDEAMYSPTVGLTHGTVAVARNEPILSTASDHPLPTAPLTSH
jgi:hypothetical protein